MNARKERKNCISCDKVVAAKYQSGFVTMTQKGGLSVEVKACCFYNPPMQP